MTNKIIATTLLFALFNFAAIAQSKKDVKKLKIKASTTVVTETVDGNEKSRTDSYQKFDNAGNVIELVEYNKDGSIKKKEAHTYNKNNDVVEEIVFDENKNTTIGMKTYLSVTFS